MINEFWETIVRTHFASGHADMLTVSPTKEFLRIQDDFGRRAVWVYDKVNKKITLEER